MNNALAKNDSTEKANDSLRGEAPQKHDVKKKTKKINPETVAARQALIAMSQEAQAIMEMGAEVEGFEECEKVNDFLLVMHQQATGCEHFKTFHDWKKEGYKVKKGSKSFRVWGSPLKAKKQGEEQQLEAVQEAESDAEKTFKFWPMCSLFNESQVEPIQGDEEPQKTEKKEPQAAPAEQQTKTVEKVKVSEFRGKIEHLERVFNVDRHACVCDKEKADWCGRVKNVLADLEGMECPRAKAEDLECCVSIIAKVKAYLIDNPEPTPPKPSKKSSESKSEAASDTVTNFTQDMGNNESLSRGLFPQSGGEFVAMTFTESKPFKTRVGAVRWLASRGIDETGRSIEEAKAEESAQGDLSSFVTVDYQDQQEDRRIRLEERAAKRREASNDAFNRSHSLVEHIPMGQPILVGHHSEARHRKAVSKSWGLLGKSVALDKEAAQLEGRAAGVGSAGIASNDPEAIAKLKSKLAGLEKSQEKMKAVNKIIRSKKLSDGEKISEIVAAELLTEAQTAEILKPDYAGRVGFASCSLSNNNAEIRRTSQRIKELDRLRNSAPVDFENDDYSMTVSNGYVVLLFPGGKPSEEVRKIVGREYSFNFSRKNGNVWQRKATVNAIASAARLLERLKAVSSIY